MGSAGYDIEELLSQAEYQDLARRLADLSQELAALARKTRYLTKRNHELERNLNGAATSLDQLRQNLKREFERYVSSV
jgi:predicted  nucleic acid-binding Zn-ribbon protein